MHTQHIKKIIFSSSLSACQKIDHHSFACTFSIRFSFHFYHRTSSNQAQSHRALLKNEVSAHIYKACTTFTVTAIFIYEKMPGPLNSGYASVYFDRLPRFFSKSCQSVILAIDRKGFWIFLGDSMRHFYPARICDCACLSD